MYLYMVCCASGAVVFHVYGISQSVIDDTMREIRTLAENTSFGSAASKPQMTTDKASCFFSIYLRH